MATLYLHSIDIRPLGDRDFTLNLVGNRSSGVFTLAASSWTIAYTKQVINMLPSPYKTKCRDFTTIGYESEYHCQMQCSANLALKQFNLSLFHKTFFLPENVSVLSKRSVFVNKTLAAIVDGIEKTCDDICYGNDCKQTFYAPTVGSIQDSDDVSFQLQNSNGPEITTEYAPQQSFPNYCVNVLSIFGVWLGLDYL